MYLIFASFYSTGCVHRHARVSASRSHRRPPCTPFRHHLAPQRWLLLSFFTNDNCFYRFSDSNGIYVWNNSTDVYKSPLFSKITVILRPCEGVPTHREIACEVRSVGLPCFAGVDGDLWRQTQTKVPLVSHIWLETEHLRRCRNLWFFKIEYQLLSHSFFSNGIST